MSDSKDRYFQSEIRQLTRKMASLEGANDRLKDRLRKNQNSQGARIAAILSRCDGLEFLIHRLYVQAGLQLPGPIEDNPKE